MSSEIAGLDVSVHSPARPEAALHEKNHSNSFPFALRLALLILLVAACAGSSLALTSASAPRGDAGVFAHPEAASVILNFPLFATYIGMFAMFLLPILGWQVFQLWSWKRRRLRLLSVPLARASAFSSVREEERKRLSRELHDSVGQVLTAVGLQLRAMRSKSLSTEQLHSRLDEACRLNGEALRLVRDLAMGLRTGLPNHIGLAAALELRARQLFDESEIRTSLQVSHDVDELPEEQRTCIYQCVLEALTNCAKHANPSSIRIQVRSDGNSVNVKVEDDGIGFDHQTLSSGLGLLGMRERIAGVNGRMSIVARQQGGTALCLEIPVVRGERV
jgi:signal transduction histidine kinase